DESGYVELAIGGHKMLVAMGSLCGGTHLGWCTYC
ncbi:hypothetical protein L195_g062465, partial [Trifolium pratense]